MILVPTVNSKSSNSATESKMTAKINGINQILCGDSGKILETIPDHAVDLIFTSPPYAQQRQQQYTSVSPDDYVAWFIPIASQLQRILKPTGTFILNIKENVIRGERSSYVLELILALRRQGWLWTEEFIWHKRNSFPGKWPNRFRDAWERLLQFNLQKKFCMYQDAVKVPMNVSTRQRLQRLRDADKILTPSQNGSPFKRNLANWQNKDSVYPDNVLYLGTESHNRHHSAVFPQTLPTWFIRLFTQEQDIVLDPFVGSGTTAIAAHQLDRQFIGIDISNEYCQIARKRLNKEAV
jgi:site-specific DNA-methyltransferase (adenine-specific)